MDLEQQPVFFVFFYILFNYFCLFVCLLFCLFTMCHVDKIWNYDISKSLYSVIAYNVS